MWKFLNRGISTPLAIGIITILVIIVGGFALWQRMEITKEENMPLPEIQIPEKEEVKDETAEWQTYRNEEYGFEVKYPEDWSIDKETIVSTGIEINIRKNNDAHILIRLGIRYNQNLGRNYYLDEWIEAVRNSMIRFRDPGYTEKRIEFAGQKATEFIFETNIPPQPPYLYREIYTGRDDKMDTIFEIVTNFDSTKENIYDPIINQIISTFKFIEEETASTPVINSISPNFGPIGTVIEIKGQNFAGFEGDLNVWIENTNRVKGIIYGETGSNGNLIKFTLKSSYCQQDNSYSGLPCSDFLNIVPGTHKIYVAPWGQESNEVIFTITSD